MITETIPAALSGERLDRVVSLILGVTRSQAAAVLAAGGVQLDGVATTVGKQRLSEGQVVTVDPGAIPEVPPPQPDVDIAFEVIHDDPSIIVVNKPAGLVVHPGAGNPDGTLVNGLLARYPEIASVGEEFRPGIVHRLDAGTSGLMVVARTEDAYEVLVGMMAAHDVERIYRTLVWGHLENAHGVIDAPIGRDQRDPQRMAVSVDGRLARTHYDVLTEFDRDQDGKALLASVLRCQLETGRTHQIRVHLAAIGHPVVGDPTYGGVRPGIAATRPMLHAAELAFAHPITGDPLAFSAELPMDIQSVESTLVAVSD